MVLTLTVPALEDNPLIVAETRPQQITQFISKLPFGKPFEAAVLMREEMEILNRQKIAAEIRFKALEVYHRALFNLKETLAIQFCNEPSPLNKHAKDFAAVAESLLLELSYGYKLALIDHQNKLISLSGSKSKAAIILRAIETLGQLAMVYYQTYFSVPPSVWSDLHQLYYYATQNSLQDIDVFLDNAEQASTISQTYKQVLLMALADPQHLAAADMKFVAEYIKYFAHHAQLMDLGAVTNPAGVFLVRLNGKESPIPYGKNARQTNASSDILLVTVELARLLHNQLQLLQGGKISALEELPSHHTGLSHQDLLIYLIRQWGASLKREFNRENKIDGIELGIGLNAVLQLVEHQNKPDEQFERNDTLSYDAVSNENTPEINPAQTEISRWQVLNISARGLSLRKLPNCSASVRVGSLFAIKLGETSHWSIGVIRWVNNNDKQQLDMGAELIAPEAESARVRAVGLNDFSPALLLPEISALKQSASIITARGVYSPAREMDLNHGSRTSQILLVKLIERTNEFERFYFSHL